MATLKEINHIMGVMVHAYPRYELSEETIKLYARLMADIPVDVLEAAAQQIMVEQTFFPTAAEWRNKAIEIMGGTRGIPSAIEAYSEITHARVDHQETTGEQDENGLWIIRTVSHQWTHPLVKQAAELIGWPSTFPTDNPMADRSQLFKVYESLLNQALSDVRILPGVRLVMDKYALPAGETKALRENNG